MLIHLHMAKNGGTSLGRTLRLRLAMWPPTRWTHPFASSGLPQYANGQAKLDAIAAMTPRQKSRVRLFESHLAFGVHEALGVDRYTYFTVLRHPVDRVLSAYDEVRATARLADMTLTEFLTFDGAPVWPPHHYPFWASDGQVRYLAGVGGNMPTAPAGTLQPHHLEQALYRLREKIAVTLILEDLTRTTRLLEHATGLEQLNSLRANTRHHRPGRRQDHLSAEDRERIEAVNQLDLQLYDEAVRLVNARLTELETNFSKTRKTTWGAKLAQRTTSAVWSIAPKAAAMALRASRRRSA